MYLVLSAWSCAAIIILLSSIMVSCLMTTARSLTFHLWIDPTAGQSHPVVLRSSIYTVVVYILICLHVRWCAIYVTHSWALEIGRLLIPMSAE